LLFWGAPEAVAGAAAGDEGPGDGSAPGVPEPAGGSPAGVLACSARALSTFIAAVMKSCQIRAGNVPPSTGPPLKAFVIGTSLFG
jgi:hypothetical protein